MLGKRINIIFGLFLCVVVSFANAGNGKVTLIHMGDIHGHLIPRPNMQLGKANTEVLAGGLAYLFDQIKKIRKKHPKSLLINTGDTLQGSAEALFTTGAVMVDILNEFKIDAFVPGNWDYVYGTRRFLEIFSGDKPLANWGPIAANLYYTTLYEFPLSPYPQLAGQRVLPPYIIKTVGNVRVGIFGLTSDRGPQIVSDRLMDGFFLSPGEEELAEAVTLLKGKKNVDLFVLISERGLAANLYLAERIKDIDIILSSDMHEVTKSVLRAKTGTLIVEEGQDGTILGELNIVVKNKKIRRWTWSSHYINTKTNTADPKIQKMIIESRKSFVKGKDFVPHVNPISAAVLRTPIDTIIGFTKTALHRSNYSNKKTMPAVIEGSSHNFLADAFKIACEADIGVIRGFRYGTHIAPGPIKLEDIYHFIPIGPQIACGMVPGSDIRSQIEKSADGSLSPWVNNWTGGWMIAYSGVTYDLDPSNEAGYRASNIRINGEAYDPAKMYKIAGFWYLDHANKINKNPAWQINVLKDQDAGIVDATEVVAYYLQSLPSKTVDPEINRIKLTESLPVSVSASNKEIQPLRGVIVFDYLKNQQANMSNAD